MDASDDCPCGSGFSYGDCCGRLHDGEAFAATAEQLMRSRYSAFALGDAAYLEETWHPDTRPRTVELGDGLEWLSLQIVYAGDDEVEFVARFRGPGGRGFVRERSKFVQYDGRWVYLAPAED
ncbi:MAG: YchJ family protein [Propionicimonas sp.]